MVLLKDRDRQLLPDNMLMLCVDLLRTLTADARLEELSEVPVLLGVELLLAGPDLVPPGRPVGVCLGGPQQEPQEEAEHREAKNRATGSLRHRHTCLLLRARVKMSKDKKGK